MIYLELFWTFFKIGAFTFGGGYAMLPLIQEAVLDHGWLEAQALIDFIAVSESTPGPFAVNMATYVGSQVGGVLGSFCATLGGVLPSFIIILIVAKCYDRFRQSRLVKGGMSGLKPAVVGLIGAAILSVSQTVLVPDGWTVSRLSDWSLYLSLAILALSLLMAFKKKHPILIICLSAACGIAGGYLIP